MSLEKQLNKLFKLSGNKFPLEKAKGIINEMVIAGIVEGEYFSQEEEEIENGEFEEGILGQFLGQFAFSNGGYIYLYKYGGYIDYDE